MTVIFTGPRRSGKTTILWDAAASWKDRRLSFGGILSLAVGHPADVSGYDLFDLKAGKAFPFLRRDGHPDWEKAGRFSVIPGAFAAASQILFHVSPEDPVIVDEAGHLELQGRGLWPALVRLISMPSLPRLIVVRDSLLDRFRVFSGLEQAPVVSAGDPEAAAKIGECLFR